VLLIDEIDKADIEFPNDLLLELDRMEFYVYETGETIKAKKHPPDRHHHLEQREGTAGRVPAPLLLPLHPLPRRETMQRDRRRAFPGIKQALVREALRDLLRMREVPGLKKKPSTSELLDWLKLLLAEDIDAGSAAARARSRKLIPPLHGALLKNEQDVHLFERLIRIGGDAAATAPA
jgi:MoxR-like ATPase